MADAQARFLIVDDEKDMRLILRGVLAPFGEVLEAEDGESALRLIRAERLSGILLDIVMPGMDGVAVMRAAHEIAPRLPVLILTGETDIEIARRALDAGARAYATKPFDIAAVSAEITRWVESEEAPEDASGRPWRVRNP